MTPRTGRLILAGLGLLALALAVPPPARAQADSERLRGAKALFFDRKYAAAREAWTGIRAAGGPDAETAAFWVARCSENLGEQERALAEYAEYLARRPADGALAEEARTSRVGLAARLYKAGRTQHLGVLQQGLSDPSRTVRYFAALQLAGLGAGVGQPAVPVLKRILAEEKDEDLVERAKLALLKVDPRALGDMAPEARPAPSAAPGAAPRAAPRPAPAAWIKLRIYERGSGEPKLSLNMPMALAELLFKSLPDDVRRDLRREGYDADNFWERLRKLGPTEIVEIVGDSGERIKIWIE